MQAKDGVERVSESYVRSCGRLFVKGKRILLMKNKVRIMRHGLKPPHVTILLTHPFSTITKCRYVPTFIVSGRLVSRIYQGIRNI